MYLISDAVKYLREEVGLRSIANRYVKAGEKCLRAGDTWGARKNFDKAIEYIAVSDRYSFRRDLAERIFPWDKELSKRYFPVVRSEYLKDRWGLPLRLSPIHLPTAPPEVGDDEIKIADLLSPQPATVDAPPLVETSAPLEPPPDTLLSGSITARHPSYAIGYAAASRNTK